MKNDILYQQTPKLVKNLISYNIHKIVPGSTHTAAIDCN